jgi:hypothetical protein
MSRTGTARTEIFDRRDAKEIALIVREVVGRHLGRYCHFQVGENGLN